MTMDCETYRRSLGRKFDAGEDLHCIDSAHASQCDACAAYRENLVALNSAFRDLPLELPRPGFHADLKRRLAGEMSRGEDVRWWIPAAAVVACLIAALGVWYYAVPLDPFVWWNALNERAVTPAWMTGEASWQQDLDLLEQYWDDGAALLAQVSGPGLWGASIAALVIVIVFNASEARRLHSERRWRS